MTELLPCPFCGERPTAVDDRDGAASISCENAECGIANIHSATLEDAAEFWNTRPNRASAAGPGMRDVLESAQRIIERDYPNGQLAIDIRAALAPVDTEVQDTWLVGGPPDLKAMSGSVESDRVIQLHFRRKATDQDRQWLLDAINAKLRGERQTERKERTGGLDVEEALTLDDLPPSPQPAAAQGEAGVPAEMLSLATEFEGEAKAHLAMDGREEATKCLRAAYALRRCAEAGTASAQCAPNRVADWLDDQARIATNSLHCGDNSLTIQRTHAWAAELEAAARRLRVDPAAQTEGQRGSLTKELDLGEYMPLSVKPLENPNHDPGKHQVLDAQTAHIFGLLCDHEMAERIVATLNAAYQLSSTDRGGAA